MASDDFVKDPDAVLDWTMDWSSWLASGDTISTSTFTASAGITITTSTNTATSAVVWLSGGTAGIPYLITNHITTSQGRTDDRSITIRVKDR